MITKKCLFLWFRIPSDGIIGRDPINVNLSSVTSYVGFSLRRELFKVRSMPLAPNLEINFFTTGTEETEKFPLVCEQSVDPSKTLVDFIISK